jgi:hypothetical protein
MMDKREGRGSRWTTNRRSSSFYGGIADHVGLRVNGQREQAKHRDCEQFSH